MRALLSSSAMRLAACSARRLMTPYPTWLSAATSSCVSSGPKTNASRGAGARGWSGPTSTPPSSIVWTMLTTRRSWPATIRLSPGASPKRCANRAVSATSSASGRTAGSAWYTSRSRESVIAAAVIGTMKSS